MNWSAMNPLVIQDQRHLEQALSTETEYAPGKWGIALPLHNITHRVKAAWLILKGQGYAVRAHK